MSHIDIRLVATVFFGLVAYASLFFGVTPYELRRSRRLILASRRHRAHLGTPGGRL